MRCFCTEIPKYQSDIAVISQMITVLSAMTTENTVIKSKLSTITGDLSVAISPANLSTLCDVISASNDDTSYYTKKYLEVCQSRLKSIKEYLRAIELEDKEYHMLNG